MKKAFVLVTAAVLLLSACSAGNKDNKALTSETQLSGTTASSAETTTVTTATATAQREIKGDMTIRNGTKLDTSEFDKVGPLIDGKVITFKNIGEPYLKTVYIGTEGGDTTTVPAYEQEIGYINCKTGEKVSLCKIKPITVLNAKACLDGTYVCIVYTKLPNEQISDNLSKNEYDELIKNSKCTILRVNVKTNEVKEYNVKLTGNNTDVFDVGFIGNDSLLLDYVNETYNAVGMQNHDWDEYIDCLNLTSGEVLSCYCRKNCSSELLDGEEEDRLFNTTQDKAYFSYKRYVGNEYVYGFQVYDSKMKLINDTEVARGKGPNTIGFAEFFVQNNNSIYCRIDKSNNGNETQEYYKFVPSGDKYNSVPYDLGKNNDDFIQYQFPRSNFDLPYVIRQTTDMNKASFLALGGGGGPDTNHNLKIQINGFICPDFMYEENTFSTDFDGDYVILSGDKEKSGYGYYYITKKEIMGALYGE